MDRIMTVSGVRNWCWLSRRIGIYTFDRAAYDPRSSQLSLIFIETCEVFLEVEEDFEVTLQPSPQPDL